MSISMTLSDLERRDGKIVFRCAINLNLFLKFFGVFVETRSGLLAVIQIITLISETD